jgi:predicted ATPase/DNA-binding SARP family transcriptional activator
MPNLKLFFLGQPRVEHESQPVELQRRTTLALLVYLAVTGAGHRRDTLATLLWPNSSQSSARSGLRRDLSILNRALGDEGLVVDRETATLRRGPGFWLDVEEFEQLVAKCHTHGHPPNVVCADCLPLLDKAVALYRDDFLAGFTLSDSPQFDEWQFFQTEGLRQRLASALERLVRGHSAGGDAGRDLALPYARRWLALDPLHEPAHRVLMGLYASAGQRAAALRQYGECVRLLEEELGVPPSRETTELYQAIKARQIPSRLEIDPRRRATPVPGSLRAGEQQPDDSLPTTLPGLPPSNLPAQTTAFVGRMAELAAVQEKLSQPEVRLLTLTGPGGSGKTRLGLQVAGEILDDFPDGVFFVALAPIRNPALIGTTIAETLGVRETGDTSTLEHLKEYVKEKRLLLLLDNFEHLLPAAPLITDLLTAAANLKILVTSRALLRLQGEWAYPVPPLSVPDLDNLPPTERLMEYEAVQLFLERAKAVKADFAIASENASAVAEICARVDGLPLAIELAAARIRVLPPHKILSALGDRLGFLTGGTGDRPARQQTIRATVDWSYNLLNAEEQTLFEHLAVFSGGCSLEAAQAVRGVSGDLDVLRGLESLVDKNLLKGSEVGGEARFAMLDTIREYALERLTARGAGEKDAVRRRHAHCFMELAEEAELHIYGTEQVVWLNRLEIEHDNLRGALEWSINHASDVALRLAGALGRFWHFRGHHGEGRDWLAKALASEKAEGTSKETLRAKALDRAGYLAFFVGELDPARAWSEESVTIWRALDDPRGLAHALCTLGAVVNAQGDAMLARALLEESIALFRGLGDRSGLVRAFFWHGHVTYRMRDFVNARASAQEAIELGREVGNISNVAGSTDTLGMIAFHEGDFPAAQSYLEESLRLMRQVEDKPGIAIMLDLLGGIAYTQGHYDEAKARVEESQLLWQDLGSKPDVAWARYFLGYVALRQGYLPQAEALLTNSLILRQKWDARQNVARCLAGLAELAGAAGRPERATRLCGATQALLKSLDTRLEIAERDRYERIPTTNQADFEHHVAALRAELGDQTFEMAWEEGQAMTLDQAVAYATSS